MRYTTGWSRRDVKTQECWERWLSGLKDGDRVMYQEFILRGNGCLSSQVECWRFWPAVFKNDRRVWFDNEEHPLRDGQATYWNSDSLHGDVFASRIVPAHPDIEPTPSGRFVDCHAPVFEPSWDEADRCFVFVGDGPDIHRACGLVSSRFSLQYRRRVHRGELFTIFAQSDEVETFCAAVQDGSSSAPRFLYSEGTLND